MTNSADPAFHTTRWTMVLRARAPDEEADSAAALEELCRRYWYPLYAFVRRSGNGPDDAQDLTQEFFARLLEKDWLDAADRERGRFRTFLMMAMKRFLANEWDRSRRIKRGGGVAPISLDAEDAEKRYATEPHTEATEGLIYDRRWAMTLLDRSLKRLESEEPPRRFIILKGSLTASRGEFDCGDAARKLGISEGAARVSVHRFRKRYREIFRGEIAETVEDPEDLREEVHYLVEILARG